MSFYRTDAKEIKPSKEVFKNFLVTQTMGRYNMASTRAMDDVGCEDGEYMYILHHYEELSKEYDIDMDNEEVRSRVNLRMEWGF